MPFCPKCRSEYRDHVTRCSSCDCDLVPALSPEGAADKGEQLRKAVEEKRAVQLARATYREATQMVELLYARGIDAMLTAPEEGACQKGRCGAQFFVAVLPEDVQDAAAALQEAYRQLIASHDEASLEAAEAVVDFDAEGEKACPACGAAFEGMPEECPDCGLYLGVG